MDFARSQLAKYGWKEGDGLGKEGKGIKEPLKPKLKFDSKGVGYSHKEFPWWEHVYNKSAENIVFELKGEGAGFRKRSSDIEISTKRMKRVKKNTSGYSSFYKAETLTNEGVTIPCETEEELDKEIKIPEISDEALFKICGGRTAHKGARHGLKLSGKLSRIEKHEKMFVQKNKK